MIALYYHFWMGQMFNWNWKLFISDEVREHISSGFVEEVLVPVLSQLRTKERVQNYGLRIIHSVGKINMRLNQEKTVHLPAICTTKANDSHAIHWQVSSLILKPDSSSSRTDSQQLFVYVVYHLSCKLLFLSAI